MKKFLDMITIAKLKGVSSGLGTRPLTAEEWKVFEECQPFVFSDIEDPESAKVDVPMTDKSMSGVTVENAPFPCFSIENASDKCLMGSGPDSNPVDFSCVMVKEISPTLFRFFALLYTKDGYRFSVLADKVGLSVAKVFLDRIKHEKVGVENTRQVVKLGSGNTKKSHRIRRIVHVVPKKYAEREKDGELRHIDFSHRFNVRGHWRKIQSALGKDRNGDYTVYGYTWVVDHEKGPEHLPLIKKTRLVEEAHP